MFSVREIKRGSQWSVFMSVVGREVVFSFENGNSVSTNWTCLEVYSVDVEGSYA